MARRRYVSTEISVDPRVNRLAETWGDFAALLYTWMIPHADDAGGLSDDPEQLIFTVVPGRRSRTIEDIQNAVDGMIELGLIEHDSDAHRLRFPIAAFAKYQSYVTKERRASAQNSAEQRTTPQNTTSFPVKVSSSVPVSSSVSSSEGHVASPAATAIAAPPSPSPQKSNDSTSEAVRAAPKPNKYAEVLDGIKALEPEHVIGGDARIDGAAVKNCPAPATVIAKCYVSLLRGEWGGDFERNSLSIQFAARRAGAYEASLRAPPKAPPRSRNGQTAVPLQTLDDQRRHYATSLTGKEQPAS